jgi:hypothetical protein
MYENIMTGKKEIDVMGGGGGYRKNKMYEDGRSQNNYNLLLVLTERKLSK